MAVDEGGGGAEELAAAVDEGGGGAEELAAAEELGAEPPPLVPPEQSESSMRICKLGP